MILINWMSSFLDKVYIELCEDYPACYSNIRDFDIKGYVRLSVVLFGKRWWESSIFSYYRSYFSLKIETITFKFVKAKI